MELNQILPLLEQIPGCSFAGIDATTEPSPGVKVITRGLRVLLFTTGRSGYEGMVRRRLSAIGKDPMSFSVGPLPWGERLANLPIIVNNGKTYLQTIPVFPGESFAMIGSQRVDIEAVRSSLRLDRDDPSQGLPSSKQVKVRCYNINHLDALRLMGEEVRS